jgi:hypothetical protein
MRIIETRVFTRQVQALLTDDEYRGLQEMLVARPDAGKVIVGTGGARKIRWATEGQGKRGGVRVIYYWATAEGMILMLLVYAKNESDTLTDQQKKALKKVIEEGAG